MLLERDRLSRTKPGGQGDYAALPNRPLAIQSGRHPGANVETEFNVDRVCCYLEGDISILASTRFCHSAQPIPNMADK